MERVIVTQSQNKKSSSPFTKACLQQEITFHETEDDGEPLHYPLHWTLVLIRKKLKDTVSKFFVKKKLAGILRRGGCTSPTLKLY